MAYDPRPMYEINKEAIEPEIREVKRPRMPWADEVLLKKSCQPRGKNVSPLLQEWINEHESM